MRPPRNPETPKPSGDASETLGVASEPKVASQVSPKPFRRRRIPPKVSGGFLAFCLPPQCSFLPGLACSRGFGVKMLYRQHRFCLAGVAGGNKDKTIPRKQICDFRLSQCQLIFLAKFWFAASIRLQLRGHIEKA